MIHLNEKITKELIKTTDSLRKKYKALRNGRETFDFQMEETFKPITKPLKDLVEQTENIKPTQKQLGAWKADYNLKKKIENFDDDNNGVNDDATNEKFVTPGITSSTAHKEIFPTTFDTSFVDSNGNSSSSSVTSKTSESLHTSRSNRRCRRSLLNEFMEQIELSKIKGTPREYMDLFVNRSNLIDNVYGIHVKDGRLKLGNKNFDIKGDNIVINKKIYKGTIGLFELIFKKKTNQSLCNNEDFQTYKAILEDTSVYRRDHDAKKQMLGHKGHKYKEIISKLFENNASSVPSGSGLMNYSKKGKQYIYWDDPNELVVRLRLLMGSHQSGHNNHFNEIISIVEELKEANIIE